MKYWMITLSIDDQIATIYYKSDFVFTYSKFNDYIKSKTHMPHIASILFMREVDIYEFEGNKQWN